MDLNTLQSWLWKAACSIRGEVDAARYKDYILPLVFYKRLDDVYADELTRVGKELGQDTGTAELFVEADRSLVRFYIPASARWQQVRKQAAGLGERITDTLRTIARENPTWPASSTAATSTPLRATSACWTTTPWRAWSTSSASSAWA